MTRSPIFLLQTQISTAPSSVSPEKATLLAQHCKDHNIELVYVDEPGFKIRVRRTSNGEGHEIVLPIATLEYMWAFSHHCWVLYQEYAAAQSTGAAEFDCMGNKRLRDSSATLEWAKHNINGSGVQEWPATGPRPKQEVLGLDDVSVATQLFLRALGWIIQHEIGHVVLSHPLGIDTFSIQQEEEADIYATDWLLHGLDRQDPRLKERALGLAVAVLCLQSLEVNLVRLRNTHPGAHERIYANTSRYECGDDEVINAMCTIVLQYLLHGTGINAEVNGPKFSEILNSLLVGVARSKESL